MAGEVNTTTEAVNALLDGVTAGPWVAEYDCPDMKLMMGESCEMCDTSYYPWTPDNEKDWYFIAAARDLVPALLAERDEWKARAEKAEAERDAGKHQPLLEVCECGMSGPCMWGECKHPYVKGKTADD